MKNENMQNVLISEQTPASAPRVLIAYHYPVVVHALRALIERQGFVVAGEALNVDDAVPLARQLQPDLAVLDFELPYANGLEAARAVHEVSPRTRCVLLARHSEELHVLKAVRLGIKGYVLKTKKPDELVQTLLEVARGGTYFSPEVSRIVVQSYLTTGRRSGDYLTEREQQVVKLIAEGASTKEVAVKLGISVKTADSHRTRVMGKLGIHETASLVRHAIRVGLVEA
jgi:two-component system response regulator NreC